MDWNVAGKQITLGGNLIVDGIWAYTVRSHIQMNGANKTIRTGSNSSSALSILTLANTSGNIDANGILKINDNFWAAFNFTGGSFRTNGQTVTANSSLLNAGGTVVINGGTLNVAGGFLVGNSGNNGAVVFSSGTLNTDALTLGDGTRTGTFSQSGRNCKYKRQPFDLSFMLSYFATNSPAINITGNWTNNGTFAAATGIVTLNGIATQTISGSINYNL